MRLYAELAPWWPLLSAPADYAAEAESFLPMLLAGGSAPAAGTAARPTLLELGSGGGNLASHLAPHFAVTLTDIAPGMLAVSRLLNPGAEHVEGDMRTLRLGRTFDAVLIHDAIVYMTTRADLRAALETAALHCRPGGTVVVAPDFVRETFAPETSHGGEDGEDGRALRYLEWMHDPDPDDEMVEVLYTVVTREADGTVDVSTERHREGCFSRDTWYATLAAAGLDARHVVDPWDREVFIAHPRAPR